MDKVGDSYLAERIYYCGFQIGIYFKAIIDNEEYKDDFYDFVASEGQVEPSSTKSFECFDMDYYFGIYEGFSEFDDVHCALRCSVKFYCAAKNCYKKNDHEGAWANLSEVRFHLGIVYCGLYIKKISESKDSRIALAIRNGKKSGDKFAPLQEVFCEILREMRPRVGWRCQQATIEFLLPYLLERCSDLGYEHIAKLGKNAVKTKLLSWLKNDDSVRGVYDGVG